MEVHNSSHDESRRVFGSSGVDLSVICFGTMRLTDPIDGMPLAQFLCELAEIGIDTHHSSSEYESYPAYAAAVAEARSAGADFKHIAKIAEPSWDHESFDGQRMSDAIKAEISRLGCERIDVVQWLVRTKTPQDDSVCVPIVERERDLIESVFEDLKTDGLIGSVAAFAYTPQMANAVFPLETPGSMKPIVDGVTMYLNEAEPAEDDQVMRSLARTAPVLAIRPFGGGNVSPDRRKEAIRSVLEHKNVTSALVSFSSLSHGRQLLEWSST